MSKEKVLGINDVGVKTNELPLYVGRSNNSLVDIIGVTPIDTLVGVTPGLVYDYHGTMVNLKNKKISTIGDEYLISTKFDLSNTENGSGEWGIIQKIADIFKLDSPKLSDDYMSFLYNETLANTENTRICEVLVEGKAPILVLPLSLNASMNTYLNGKAKRYALIVTNNSGFAKLDIKDSNGNSLIKKNSTGAFVYDDKYIVFVFDDEILPNLVLETDYTLTSDAFVDDNKIYYTKSVVGGVTTYNQVGDFSYVLTEDTELVENKSYYIVNELEEYVKVADPTIDNLEEYCEIDSSNISSYYEQSFTYGTPVIMGDIKSAITIVRYKETRVTDNDTELWFFKRRYIEVEEVLKRTNDNKCYILGYLA